VNSEGQNNQAGSGGNGPARRRKRNNRRRRTNPSGGPGIKSGGAGGDNPEVGNKNPSGERGINKNPGGPGGPGGVRPPPQQRRRRTIPQNNNDDRVLSKTAVFVANLPFTVKDEDLLNSFKEHTPKAAHVVVTRNGRSRGYGFVDFELERDQQAAILTKNNAKFVIGEADRVITVTPSYKTQEVAPEN